MGYWTINKFIIIIIIIIIIITVHNLISVEAFLNFFLIMN